MRALIQLFELFSIVSLGSACILVNVLTLLTFHNNIKNKKREVTKMKKIKVLFLDVEKGANAFTVMEIEDKLDTYYTTLRVDTIDIVRRRIGGIEYQIVLDDNGLLKDRPIVSAEDFRGCPALVGNLIITGLCDREGNLTSLTQKDIERITKKLVTRFSFVLQRDYKRLRLSV